MLPLWVCVNLLSVVVFRELNGRYVSVADVEFFGWQIKFATHCDGMKNL